MKHPLMVFRDAPDTVIFGFPGKQGGEFIFFKRNDKDAVVCDHPGAVSGIEMDVADLVVVPVRDRLRAEDLVEPRRSLQRDDVRGAVGGGAGPGELRARGLGGPRAPAVRASGR